MHISRRAMETRPAAEDVCISCMNETDYFEKFNIELENIEKLVITPNMMRDLAIKALDKALTQNLKHTTKNSLVNTKAALENVQDASISRNYEIIYSQMLILAVSSLEATLKEYFKEVANDPHNLLDDNIKLKRIKISALDLIKNDLSYIDSFGDLLLQEENASFQSLKLIKETFSSYFGHQINLTENIEVKLIYYLEMRHVLVHKSGVIDEHFVNATRRMRAHIGNYNIGDKIELKHEDWQEIKTIFPKLVKECTQR